MKKILKFLLIVIAFLGINYTAHAEDPATINLTIRDGGSIVFSGSLPLRPAGTLSLNDSDGNPHDVNADSVLAVINDADVASDAFSISSLTYFSSFGSLYLKCISDSFGNQCDNWQYLVNDSYAFAGMDQNVLAGGENIYLYFGPQNKVVLSSNAINTSDTLTVTTEAYDYQNNGWTARTGVTVGLTQPNANDPFSPLEITTGMVDADGKITFSSIPAGNYDVGIKEDFYFPTEPLTVSLKPHQSGGGSNTMGSVLGETISVIPTPISKPIFDADKAFKFLSLQQEDNGSFGEDIYTDWVAMAFASSPGYKAETIILIKYFPEKKFTGTLLTDFERHAMSLMALGLNPYNKGGENYIQKITYSFDGVQFGEKTQDNDDIFALIVLQNAGFTIEDKMINEDIAFILSRQKEDGSWDGSPDMTSASMQALSIFSENGQVKNALVKAKDFLKKNQKEDGGWGNVSSTAWAIGGILALSETPEEWDKNNATPIDYLTANQDIDGGTKNEILKNKIWETAYTATALSGKTWNQIMQKFEKQKIVVEEIKPKAKPQSLPKEKKAASLANLASQNTKSAIAPVADTPKEIQPVKQNWFKRLLNNIIETLF